MKQFIYYLSIVLILITFNLSLNINTKKSIFKKPFPLKLKFKNGPSQNEIGWLLKDKNAIITEDLHKDFGPFTTRNLTRFWSSALNEIKNKIKKKPTSKYFDNEAFKKLNNYYYLLVPGLLTKFYPFYLDGVVDVMNKMGFQVSRAPIDTGETIVKNSETIRNYIIQDILPRTNKKIVMIGHSKGSNDQTDSLLLHPEIKQFIGGIINMQGPFGGSALGNDLENGTISTHISDFVISKILRENPKSLKSLTYKNRMGFYQSFKYYDLNLPILNLATYSQKKISLLYPLIQWGKSLYHQNSDGMVMMKDAILPGFPFIMSSIFDHADPGFDYIPNICGVKSSEIVLTLMYLWSKLVKKH